jgi:hypothetical protein
MAPRSVQALHRSNKCSRETDLPSLYVLLLKFVATWLAAVVQHDARRHFASSLSISAGIGSMIGDADQRHRHCPPR